MVLGGVPGVSRGGSEVILVWFWYRFGVVSWATIITIRTTMINDTCGARPVVAAGVVDPAAPPEGALVLYSRKSPEGAER